MGRGIFGTNLFNITPPPPPSWIPDSRVPLDDYAHDWGNNISVSRVINQLNSNLARV